MNLIITLICFLVGNSLITVANHQKDSNIFMALLTAGILFQFLVLYKALSYDINKGDTK